MNIDEEEEDPLRLDAMNGIQAQQILMRRFRSSKEKKVRSHKICELYNNFKLGVELLSDVKVELVHGDGQEDVAGGVHQVAEGNGDY